MSDESGTQDEGGQAPEGGTPPAGEQTPPENQNEGGSQQPDPVEAARAEAERARAAADEAKNSATTEAAAIARERSELADQKLAFAEQQAKAGNSAFPKEVVDKLRNESAGYRTKLRDAEAEVQKLKDAAKTDTERLEGAARTAEERAVKAEGRLARLLVARKAGLPDDVADRLVGDDEEALTKDAEKFAKLLGKEQPKPNLDQGSRGGAAGEAGAGGGNPRAAMNDFIRSHGGRREVPGRTGATRA